MDVLAINHFGLVFVGCLARSDTVESVHHALLVSHNRANSHGISMITAISQHYPKG